MNEPEKFILVSGATGRQGGAVIQHLLNNNLRVKALSRTPESLAAQRLAAKGVIIVKGDMSDHASLFHAMENCNGVFSIQNFFEYGGEKEIEYGKNMVDAALKNNVSHFIYNSVCNANDNTGVPHFETKSIIEKYVKHSGIPSTIARPVKFMENYYIPQVFKGILSGKLFDPIQSGKKHQMIAVDDVGAYVATAFLQPNKYIGREFEIAGEELTNEEIAAIMSAVLGKNVKFKRLPIMIARLAMDKEMYLMFKWFTQKGFNADMNKIKNDFPSVGTTSLKTWLMNEHWDRWNKKGTI